jgi:hypothetical protein
MGMWTVGIRAIGMWTVVTATATDIVTTIHIVRVVAIADVAVGVRVEVTDVRVSGGVGVVTVVDPANVAGAVSGGSRCGGETVL